VAVVWLLAAVAVVERGLVERGLAERVAVAVVWLLVAVVWVAAVLASAWASAWVAVVRVLVAQSATVRVRARVLKLPRQPEA